jgi:hypothetical protein
MILGKFSNSMMIRSSPDSLWLRPAASRFHSIVSFFPKELGTMQKIRFTTVPRPVGG